MTMTTPESRPSLYVYGIVRADAELPHVKGLRGGEVSAVPFREHSALITRIDEDQVIGTPDDLVAHGRALDDIAAEVSVLPMVFGTVVPDEESLVRDVLAVSGEDYDDGLNRVSGAVQFSLRARFVQEAVLAELVREEPEVAELRERIAGTSVDETHGERMRLGELIVRGLEAKADSEAPRILEALAPLAREIVERERGQAEDVIDLAALVDRQHTARFEQVAEDLARAAAGRITFRLVGPQAPYDFVAGQ